MKSKLSFLFIALLLCTNLVAQDWLPIETEAKPASRWWWLGSAVDSANITYNLEEYAKTGLGGLEITPIYGVKNNEGNDIDYLSPRWMEMLQFIEKEGKRVGIEIDMNNGTGWPFGGPEVTLEDAATQAIFQNYNVMGGQKVSLDISVENPKQRDYATLSCLMAYEEKGKCIDITSYCTNNTLTWDAPKGKWELIALFIGKTRQKVKRAAPGGEGYVIDHLSKDAVTRYLSKFDAAFQQSGTPYPHTFFNDSYEVYGADWTPNFLSEFEKRRGYRLQEHFHEFLDKERNEVTRRLVSDYRETFSELLIENFTNQWSKWAHKNGSITRNQAHGSPANLIDTYAAVDIPECEGFGLSPFNIKGLRKDSMFSKRNDSDLSMLKYASSAAHISGKKFTSSETFTWLTEHFRTSLSQCKPDMDLMFVSGVNHMFFHGTPYSPKQAEWPGWLFYAAIEMSPINSIWRDAPPFFDYIARCQSFLQWGKPDNDFLVYLPVYDMWDEQPGRLLQFDIHSMRRRAPHFIEAINAINESGYDVDYISDSFILSTICSNGELITTGGTPYKAILVPDVKLMPNRVLKHLIQLAEQGATVVFIGNYPKDVPGYGNLTKRQKEFQKILKQLPSFGENAKSTVSSKKKGKIITGTDYRETLQLCGVAPESMKTDFGLQCIRRKNNTGYHYFITSLQENEVCDWITLGVTAKSAMLFDAVSGKKGLALLREHEGKTQVFLQLHSGESAILQTFDEPLAGAKKWEYTEQTGTACDLNKGWTLHFVESAPEVIGNFSIDTPKSWTEIGDSIANITMGTGCYTLHFTLPQANADDWILDLGDVRESARVYVNKQYAGTAWCVPYRMSIGEYLKEGNNLLEIEVTNLAANRIAEYDRQNIPWRNFKEINVVDLNYRGSRYGDWEPMPSGLNSKVQLIPVNHKRF